MSKGWVRIPHGVPRKEYMFLYENIYERNNMTWKDKLKAQWDANPMQVILIGAFAATAAAKVLDAVSSAQGRHAYAKQVDYRVSHKR